jgi:Ca2+-binding EF-hand superfamily protein
MTIEQRAMKGLHLCLPALFLIATSARCGVAEEARKFCDPEELLSLARAHFSAADRDGDGKLTMDELLSSYPAAEHADRKRQFAEFDSAGDGKLSRGEFAKLFMPNDDRGEVPDPIVEIEEEALSKMRAVFDAADREGAGVLVRGDWPEKQIARQIPALAVIQFDQWDKNRDGKVDDAEVRWLLDVSYGLRRPDGRPLRTANGPVLSWNYVRLLDTDHDGGLSREEFVPKYMLGEAKNAELFSKLDTNHDGRLDDDEMASAFWRDTLGEFFSLDADGDGRLRTEDLLKFGYAEGICQRTVRACDDDGDGTLSFIEFRATTFENPTSDWYATRRDADDDGRLSWKEFNIEEPPALTAQCRYIFDRFDLDKDGYLSYAEWDFEVNLAKVPPEESFRIKDLDGDGKLTFSEVFAEKKPADGDPRALDRFEMRLAAAESRFLSDDRDGNGYLDLDEHTRSLQSAVEAARRHSNRRTMLEGNYYVRKGVLVVNEIAFLAIVWWVVRRTKPRRVNGRK